MSNFTPNQTSAILFTDGNCLVSAGAGSGKTAVLTERIFWLIVPPLDPEFDAAFKASHDGHVWGPDDKEDPVFLKGAKPRCKASEILVLTFGKSAAIEMKDRVRQKIRAHRQTAHYLPSVEESDISNFDSFWLKMVNDAYFELGLPCKISIVDETFVKVLTKRYIEEVINEKSKLVLEGKEEVFAGILKEKCLKDTNFIFKAVISVLNLSSLAKDVDSFFDNYERDYLSDEAIEDKFNEFSRYLLATLRKMVETIKANYDDDTLSELDVGYIEGYLSCQSFDEMHKHYLEGKNKSFPVKPKSANLSRPEVRDAIKKEVMEAISMLSLSKGDYIEFAKSQRPKIRLFVEMANEVRLKREAWMREHACYDFSGVANLMQRLLSIPRIREEFKRKYRYIMLDEYQDTSNSQEDLIQSIATDNVFAVGDIKQSIYRFRKANPKTFYTKLIAYGKGKGGYLVTLPDNFRSREEVIKGVNRIFEKIMKEDVGGVDYSNNQALNFGNHRLFDPTSKMEEYGFKVLEYPAEKGIPKQITEAELIAADIKDKVASGFKVTDKKGKPRACVYGDFAVLVSRKSGFSHYVKAFKDAGIPLSVKDVEFIGEDDVVIVFKSILAIMDMLQRRDFDEALVAHSCLSLARSFLFRMDDGEIYSLIKERRYKDFPFYQKLVSLAKDVRSLPLKEVFLTVFREFDFAKALAGMENVEMNYKKVISLLTSSEALENIGMGLDEVIRYLDDIARYKEKFTVDGGNLEPAAVKIMSDHYSKGLQYKVCYFPELWAKFVKEGKSFSATTEYGVCLSSLGEDGVAKNDFLSFMTSKREHAENVSERLRLFYVALTRPEEMAILLVPKTIKDNGTREEKPPVMLTQSNSFLDFFLGAGIAFPYLAPLPPVKKENEEEKPAEPERFEKIQIVNIDKKGKVKVRQRASIELSAPLDPGILEYGIHLHRVMELTDFGKKKLPEGLSLKEKEKFERVLALPIFDKANEGKEYHEYDYYDEDTGEMGSIDLFIVYDDHIDLIDYKSESEDIEKYSAQLASYANYLTYAFPGLRIDKYILSIGKATLNRVD